MHVFKSFRPRVRFTLLIPFGLAALHTLSSHVWLEATVVDSMGLETEVLAGGQNPGEGQPQVIELAS